MALTPITPFLAHQAFDPEIIKTMSAAYVATCHTLHLKVGDDPATRLVAETVINFAQRAFAIQMRCANVTLKEFGLERR